MACAFPLCADCLALDESGAVVLRLVVYDEEMVGVNKKLETRRALGANTAIEMPDKPERPRRKLFPPDEEMWAVILDGEARTKGRGRK